MKLALRLVLTEGQSAALADHGTRFAVVVVHPGSWPEHPGRMILDLIDTDQRTADDIVRVLTGKARVRRIRTTAATK